MSQLNETHDPKLQSWVDSANDPEADFPLQNLPFGVFADPKSGKGRVGVAIGDMILDVVEAREKSVIGGSHRIRCAVRRRLRTKRA